MPKRLDPCSVEEAKEILKERYMTITSIQVFFGVGYRKGKEMINGYYTDAHKKYGWIDRFRIPMEYFIEIAHIDTKYYGFQEKK